MENKMRLICPVVVEGRYDKAKVCAVVETPVISIDGFSVFNNNEKKQLLKRLCGETGLIILTDSDRAGGFIRSKLKGFLSGNVYNVYIPPVEGKERRKQTAGADGLLGVEGMSTSVIRELLEPYRDGNKKAVGGITKARFYADGFSGRPDSSKNRELLAKRLSLPIGITANALLEAVNLLVSEEEYSRLVNDLVEDTDE